MNSESNIISDRFLGTGPNVTVVDTPGFKDTEDAEFVDELMNVLGDEVTPKSILHTKWAKISPFLRGKIEHS